MRWLALLGCFSTLVALGQPATVPAVTTDTMVVARTEEEVSSPSPSVSSDDDLNSDMTTDGPTPPIKLQEMAVVSEVSLRYAHTSIVTKMRNPAKKAQEATFRVLLPDTAFISGFVMILDGKPYKAYVKEKEEAKQIYNDAVTAGIGAAHIAAKARDSNHFTVSVNVEPRTTAVFNLTYEELLVRRNKVYNHAINLHPGALVPKLTVTVHIKEVQKITELRVPEIRTGNEVDATENDAQNSKAVITRGHDDREATITFSPDLDEQKRLMEIYAEKAKETRSNSHRYWDSSEKETAPEGMLGQFVVQYDVDRPKEGEILVNDGYFVHFFAPSDLPPLHKHVVFVLDTSGSMMDRKIIQLREAMRTILSELNPGDYFSIVEFATSVKVYDLKEADLEPVKPEYSYYTWEEKPATLVPPSPATPDNIARAKTIVGRLNASGGTNIASALNVAVDLINKGIGWKQDPTTPKPDSNDKPRAEPIAAQSTTEALITTEVPVTTEVAKKDDSKKLEPIIIFLTDGDPTVGETDPVRIINRLVEKNYGENKAAIFSLAFGEDADRSFLRKLSLRNDGFMRHIYEASDAALQLRDFYRQVASPLLADVHFNYPKEQIKEGSLTKSKFRAYYSGSETVVAGRVADGALQLAPRVVGVCGVDDAFIKRKKYEISPKVPVSRAAGQYLPLERLWAYLTIKQLLDEKDAADNENKDDENSPEKKALQIALKYEFVTPLTSLVVVKPNATNAVDAESVDKQSSSYGVPLAAFSGAPGLSGPAAPQLQYSLLSRPQLASFSHAAAYPVQDSVLYEQTEDYDGESGPASYSSQVWSMPVGNNAKNENGARRVQARRRNRPQLRKPSSIKLQQQGPEEREYSSEPSDNNKTNNGAKNGVRRGQGRRARPRSRTPGSIQLLKQQGPEEREYSSEPSDNNKTNNGAMSAWSSPFPAPTYMYRSQFGGSSLMVNMRRPEPAVSYRVVLTKAASKLPDNAYDDVLPPKLPEIALDNRRPPPVILPPSTRRPSTTSRASEDVALAAFHLQEYPWVSPALVPGKDALELDVPNNGSIYRVELQLTRDVAAPKGAADAECERSTDGTAGVCVYLTRCEAAKTITLDQYKTSFCGVNAKFAGVCCPRAKVDVGGTKS